MLPPNKIGVLFRKKEGLDNGPTSEVHIGFGQQSAVFSRFLRNSLVKVTTLPIAVLNGYAYLRVDCRDSDMERSVKTRVVLDYLMKE